MFELKPIYPVNFPNFFLVFCRALKYIIEDTEEARLNQEQYPTSEYN